LNDDIAQQEALLAEIRDEEHGYEAEGRKEAANRLHEQLSFIEVYFAYNVLNIFGLEVKGGKSALLDGLLVARGREIAIACSDA
jgi:hypothetical protein